MTVDSQNAAPTPAIVDEEKSSMARLADTAGTEASNVAATAAEGAKEIAGEASTQTKAVVSQAKQQVDSLITQTREEVRQQAETRSAQAAGGLHTLSDQVAALAEGRPDNAGSLPRYLEDVQEHVRGLASKLEHGGPQGVIDDITRLRPPSSWSLPCRRRRRGLRRRTHGSCLFRPVGF